LEDPRRTDQRRLSLEQWKQLITLAHFDKARAFDTYVEYYRTTDGQLYDSDRQQMSTYFPDYHEVIAEALGADVKQSLVITELYVPRDRLIDFLDDVRSDMRRHHTDLVYGVVRWIERDNETFLPWARKPYACVIFNLNVRHDGEGRAKAAADFRRLIDRALERGGSYYLTYHRHATRLQVESAYPEFADMLAEKERRDPQEVWRSDWHDHYRRMFGGV
jgi:FAD/FMN-containing dehydrogenase